MVKPSTFRGDGAIVEDNGYITITGRVDDVINISGHRIGTAEIESAIAHHPKVAETAVVGKPDEIVGEAIFAYIVLKGDMSFGNEAEMMKEINDIIVKEIGAFAKVSAGAFVNGLPKTRSGKIMRRIFAK